MTSIVGRNVKVQVALTFDSPNTVTALTLANPGVATSTAHGQVDGDVGYFTATAGMVEIDQQAVVVDDKTNDTFDCASLNTTGYSTWTAGTFTAAATWGTVSEAVGYEVPDAAADQLDDSRLMDTRRSMIAGLMAAQGLTIRINAGEEDSSAMAFINAAAIAGTNCLFKVTKGSTILRVFYGVPSISGESVGVGAIGTGSIVVTGKGFALKPSVSLA